MLGGGFCSLIHTLKRGANVTNIKAFPKGFRMVTGDARKRSKQYTEGLGTQQEIRCVQPSLKFIE